MTLRNGRRTTPVLVRQPFRCVIGQTSPANELDGRGFLKCYEWSDLVPSTPTVTDRKTGLPTAPGATGILESEPGQIARWVGGGHGPGLMGKFRRFLAVGFETGRNWGPQCRDDIIQWLTGMIHRPL